VSTVIRCTALWYRGVHASKGTSCIQYSLHWRRRHQLSPESWYLIIKLHGITCHNTTMLSHHHENLKSIYQTIWLYARHMRFIMRYEVWGNNMWGSDSAVQWGALKCCEMWQCVSECALSAFCWIWCLPCEGWAVQVESSPLKTEALQLLKMSATAYTTTQHHMWHYIPADHNLDTKQVLLLTLLLIWGLWVAKLTNSITDFLLFQPTNCLLGLRSY